MSVFAKSCTTVALLIDEGGDVVDEDVARVDLRATHVRALWTEHERKRVFPWRCRSAGEKAIFHTGGITSDRIVAVNPYCGKCGRNAGGHGFPCPRNAPSDAKWRNNEKESTINAKTVKTPAKSEEPERSTA
jgi:hypothetical protein